MNASHTLSRVLLVVGLLGMLVGAIDPLEGCVVILAGVAAAALGALLGQTRHRKYLYWASAMVAAGVAVMVVLSAVGGIGGNSGRSTWWALLALPYPAGWLLGLTGAVLALIEWYKHHTPPRQALQ